jgi:transcriptional regulator with XRE-family HTH domain
MKGKGKKTRSRDKESFDPYAASRLKALVADQIKQLRGDMSQEEFGKLLGKPQSVISRLEDPNYGKVTLQTLLEIAAKLDVALAVQFVSHATYQRLMELVASAPLGSGQESNKEEGCR